jgi:hypothetical protein
MAAARKRSNAALAHPFLLDELLHNLRDSTSLESRSPRQIGTGKRLVGTDQLKHDIPVDSTRSFTGGELNVSKVYMPDSLWRLPQLHLIPSRKESTCASRAAQATSSFT